MGITEDELLRCESGEPDEMEEALRELSPLGITDLARAMPRADESDLEQLQVLQNAVAGEAVALVPPSIRSFAVTVRREGKELGLWRRVFRPVPAEPPGASGAVAPVRLSGDIGSRARVAARTADRSGRRLDAGL